MDRWPHGKAEGRESWIAAIHPSSPLAASTQTCLPVVISQASDLPLLVLVSCLSAIAFRIVDTNGTLVIMHLKSGRSTHRAGQRAQPSHRVRRLMRQPGRDGINTGAGTRSSEMLWGTPLVDATRMDFETAPFTSSRLPHTASASLVCFLGPLDFSGPSFA